MARSKMTIRPVRLELALPEDLYARAAIVLFSDVEQRIPYGAWSGLFTELLRIYLKRIGA